MTDAIDIKLIQQADSALMDTQVISDLVSEYYTQDDHGALLDALGLCNDAIKTLGKLKRTISSVLTHTEGIK